MTNLALAGLDGDQDATTQPWLRALQAPKPRSWEQVAAMRQPAAVPAAEPNAALDASRRLRVASRTPSGEPQPPEVAGVDASARVPNEAQPMSGEIDDGREVGRGKPSFFSPSMPPPTGTSDNVGVSRGTHPFGAPLGMTTRSPASNAVRLRLAALPQPDGNPEVSNLAALPHFATGGVLDAGGSGVVGEDGEEEIDALPGGGVAVKPLAAGPAEAHPDEAVADLPGTHAVSSLARPDRSAALAAMVPQPNAGAFHAATAAAPAPAPTALTPVQNSPMTPRAQRELYGYGTDIAAPPAETTARDAYMRAIRAEQGEAAPQPTDAKYHVPLWRKIMAVGAGALAGGFARPQDAAKVGEETASVIAPNRYARDAEQFNQQQAREQKQIGNLQNAVRDEDTANTDAERVWQADQANRRAQATADQNADYRQQEAERQQQQDAATQAYRNQQIQLDWERLNKPAAPREPQLFQDKDGSWYAWNPETNTAAALNGVPRGARRGNLPTPKAAPRPTAPKAAEVHAQRLSDFDKKISGAPNRDAAESYVRKNFASFAAAGITPAEINAAMNNYFPVAGTFGNQ